MSSEEKKSNAGEKGTTREHYNKKYYFDAEKVSTAMKEAEITTYQNLRENSEKGPASTILQKIGSPNSLGPRVALGRFMREAGISKAPAKKY